jgi:hypothetical protein
MSGFENELGQYCPTYGKMDASQKMHKLRELEDRPEIEAMNEYEASGRRNFFEKEAWQHTEHQFGYIQNGTSTSLEIIDSGSVNPDKKLMNSKIDIRLNRFRVYNYPGNGMHRVLLNFNTNASEDGKSQAINFNQVYRAQEGQGAGVIGYPIFNGLNVGLSGIGFSVFTINVSNDIDEEVLSLMESSEFSKGVELINTSVPIIGTFSSLMLGVAKMIGKRNRNVPVQDFYIGLDFGDDKLGAHLRSGSYIAVQAPSDNWDWSKWVFDTKTGTIIGKNKEILVYNYIVFGISKHTEAALG